MSADGPSQNENLLVVAGAGTGKTHNLVQTVVRRLKDEAAPLGVDELLIVTFTKAAAAELRHRISKALQDELAANPASTHLARQIAMLDRAQISTLHSFCLELVSRDFSELGLSPRLTTLEQGQAAILERETLDAQFESYYEPKSDRARAIQKTLLDYFRGNDFAAREIVLALHQFTQTRPDPQGWFAEQRAVFTNPDSTRWRALYDQALGEWVESRRADLEAQSAENNPARAIVLGLLEKGDVAGIAAVYNAGENESIWPRGSKVKFRSGFKTFYDEAAMLAGWARTADADPLAEDWKFTRETALLLLDMAEEFHDAYARVKRERGLIDFHDLEQFSLQLLWDREKNAPTPRANFWRQKFKWIFVDEYQDINPVQDRIIEALARPDAVGNRYLVGDVKQSIYGFRQADSRIFGEYHAKWNNSAAAAGRVQYLTQNWRSHERILDFVNGLFGGIMTKEVGDVSYDENARLQFANDPSRAHLSRVANSAPQVEVHCLEPDPDEKESDDEGDAIGEIEKDEREAEALAVLCRRLVETKPLTLPTGSTARYDDIVILVRSARRDVDQFAKIFARHKIPFQARRAGFFDSIEVVDLCNVLRLLDNPLQDLPLLGVLRSPIGGFSVEELAAVRIATPRGNIWDALVQFAEKKEAPAAPKAARFLQRVGSWRELARHSSLAERLEQILEDSGYEDWAGAQDGGTQRRANIRRLIELARQFDELRGEGLYPFLQYITDQAETNDTPPPNVASAGAVRLMTIHQSKGLQFPIVIVAGLHRKFNASDFKGLHLIDDEFGLCLKARPPGSRRQYETLGFWLAGQRQRRKLLHEEMRILYVALTRAQFRLLLVGAPSKKTVKSWEKSEFRRAKDANSMLDWIGPWLTKVHDPWLSETHGQAADWRWRWHSMVKRLTADETPSENPLAELPAESAGKLRARLEWAYPFAAATAQEAKSSATALRRGLSDEPELARPIVAPKSKATTKSKAGNVQASELGQATHRFLELAPFSAFVSESKALTEIQALEKRGELTREQAEAINLERIFGFWQSSFGAELLSRPETLRRELVFTARFSRTDLLNAGAPELPNIGADEFIVVQGAADLAALFPHEIWLVDFKTDCVPPKILADRLPGYQLQLRIYAAALRKIYKRPVTRACLHFLEFNRTEWLDYQPGYLPLI